MYFQLADIRGNNKKYTLLKFLILQLQQSNPEALNFPDELKSVPKAAACKSKTDLHTVSPYMNNTVTSKPVMRKRNSSAIIQNCRDVHQSLNHNCSQCSIFSYFLFDRWVGEKNLYLVYYFALKNREAVYPGAGYDKFNRSEWQKGGRQISVACQLL